jgi:Uma2 family endonuclease
MSATLEKMIFAPPHRPRRGEPAWDMALLFPVQGQWTEGEYLSLCEKTNWLIELNDGILEVLPMPKPYHQRIAQFLFNLLESFVIATRAGEVFIAPLPVRLWEEQMRQPDVVFLRHGRISDPEEPPEGADLAIEIVSPARRVVKGIFRTSAESRQRPVLRNTGLLIVKQRRSACSS